MLRENVKSQEMEETIDRCWTEYPNGLVAYIEKGDVPKGGKGLARYLAKYVVSPPISLKEFNEKSSPPFKNNTLPVFQNTSFGNSQIPHYEHLKDRVDCRHPPCALSNLSW